MHAAMQHAVRTGIDECGCRIACRTVLIYARGYESNTRAGTAVLGVKSRLDHPK